jgi:hypothetical protein
LGRSEKKENPNISYKDLGKESLFVKNKNETPEGANTYFCIKELINTKYKIKLKNEDN